LTRRGSRLAWRKLASAKWEDAWVESLGFLGATRIAITSFPGGKTIRLEAFSLAKKEAAALTSRFGGTLRELRGESPGCLPVKAREPIRIRSKLVVVDSAKALAGASRLFPHRKVVVIPAGAAFGTGEHATTSSCLRLLCDLSEVFEDGRWKLLDLGTGSGILAIAASKLGAGRVTAWDFDADAIRTARENVRANGVANVALKRGDVTAAAGSGCWEVVSANLYSRVLIRASAEIAGTVRPGGYLILSGILREQEAACKAAFERLGVKMERRLRLGKWATLLWRKPPRRGESRQVESLEKLLTASEGHDR